VLRHVARGLSNSEIAETLRSLLGVLLMSAEVASTSA
jgi:hypothetical protein